MELATLQDLYVDQLRDLYNAENQLIKALPKMADAASTPELQEAFSSHLTETKGHVERLDRIFKKLGVKATGKTCKAMQGLVEEGKEVIGEKGEDVVIDAALIAAAQRVEHYEMAGYGCVRSYAKILGDEDAANILQQTLDEEGEANKALTQLAQSVVNNAAAAAHPA